MSDRVVHIPITEVQPGDSLYLEGWGTARSVSLLYDGPQAQRSGGKPDVLGYVVLTSERVKSYFFLSDATVMAKLGPGALIEATS